MSVPYDTRAGWQWPNTSQEQVGGEDAHLPGGFVEDPETKQEEPKEVPPHTPPPRRHYGTRTCRICLEEVSPTFEGMTDGIPSILHPAPRVQYISAEAESGRLIRPCKCRGSQKYVHEGCLQEWRHADPAYGRRNYWECPTCKYRYRLERMGVSRWITSIVTQIIITAGIMLLLVFAFGFVADPIINLYLDPLDTIISIPSGGATGIQYEEGTGSWVEHFLKGLASLGLLGFVKVFFAMSPFNWINIRAGGVFGGGRRRRGGGRDRLEDISWTVVVIGVITFLTVSNHFDTLVSLRTGILTFPRWYGPGFGPGLEVPSRRQQNGLSTYKATMMMLTRMSNLFRILPALRLLLTFLLLALRLERHSSTLQIRTTSSCSARALGIVSRDYVLYEHMYQGWLTMSSL
jgi:hypothetical protein